MANHVAVNDNQDQLRFLRSVFYSQLKSKVGNILAKATAVSPSPAPPSVYESFTSSSFSS